MRFFDDLDRRPNVFGRLHVKPRRLLVTSERQRPSPARKDRAGVRADHEDDGDIPRVVSRAFVVLVAGPMPSPSQQAHHDDRRE
jgi:hypothetical protein